VLAVAAKFFAKLADGVKTRAVAMGIMKLMFRKRMWLLPPGTRWAPGALPKK